MKIYQFVLLARYALVMSNVLAHSEAINNYKTLIFSVCAFENFSGKW